VLADGSQGGDWLPGYPARQNPSGERSRRGFLSVALSLRDKLQILYSEQNTILWLRCLTDQDRGETADARVR
jgi:hypothetical protein